MIALADHNLLLIKLNLPSNTPRLRNPVRGSPDLTLAQINAVQCICIMWMQKEIRAQGFFSRDVERAAKEDTPFFPFLHLFSGLLDRLRSSAFSLWKPK